MSKKGLIAFIIGAIAVTGVGLYVLKKAKASTTTTTTSGVNVSNLSICDPSIKNGDYVYVNNQADTGYTGYFVIIDVSDMQNDASYANECGATASQWIWNHPFANGIYYNYVGTSPPT